MEPDGIAIVSIPSGEIRGVSPQRGQPGASLDWSPDDSMFALVTGDGVVTVSAADGSAKTLVRATPRSGSCSGSTLSDARWSPDGRWIAYLETRCVQEGEAFLRSTISIMSAAGVWRNDIDNYIWGHTNDIGPRSFVWSPDSRYIAFIDDALATEGEFFLELATSAPTGSYKRLKAGAYGVPSWQRLSP
jgi:Tol biopolymer transport system component